MALVEMARLEGLKTRMLALPDKQISLTDPDARSMATSGRGSGVVGYNVQASVDTDHHLIIAHEVTNVGTDRAQLSAMAKKAKVVLGLDELDVVADRGDFSSLEILACDRADITVTLPKPVTSGIKAKVTRAAAPHLRSSAWGRAVNIGSTADRHRNSFELQHDYRNSRGQFLVRTKR
jgi:hypothetical protein